MPDRDVARVRLKRSPHLVAYWRLGRLYVRSYATGAERPADATTLEILDRAGAPTDPAELQAIGNGAGADVVDELVAAGILRRTGGDRRSADRDQQLDDKAFEKWRSWSPEAALFHFATKDYPFRDPGQSGLRVIGPERPPEPLKQYPADIERIDLPPFPRRGPLPETLLARRTWRQFGDRQLDPAELSALLGLTWAVQAWAPGVADARLAFKTSPSGGAKHSIEAYVAALRVDGLEPATYHYCPDRHALARVADPPDAEQLGRFLPAQPYFTEAAAIFFMTSVFARVQWKYRYPRAYRVVLIEAGHLAQTFCLLGTAMELAPFCTAALGDSAIEAHLGIDGVTESVLYVAGIGARPAGIDWAPFGDERKPPARSAPRHRERDPDVE